MKPLLLVGLGNPGAQYAWTRHNAGFLFLEAFQHRHHVQMRPHALGVVGQGVCEGQSVLTLQPHTFMNLSGKAVQSLMAFYKLPLESLYVIHDDIESPLGRVRFKTGGGDRGHKGLRSITQCVGRDYHRIGIGVGRPPSPMSVSDYVLSSFPREERPILKNVLEDILDRGLALREV